MTIIKHDNQYTSVLDRETIKELTKALEENYEDDDDKFENPSEESLHNLAECYETR